MTAAAGVMVSSHLRVLHDISALKRHADPLLLSNECEQNLLKDYIRNGSLYEDYRNRTLNDVNLNL